MRVTEFILIVSASPREMGDTASKVNVIAMKINILPFNLDCGKNIYLLLKNKKKIIPVTLPLTKATLDAQLLPFNCTLGTTVIITLIDFSQR